MLIKFPVFEAEESVIHQESAFQQAFQAYDEASLAFHQAEQSGLIHTHFTRYMALNKANVAAYEHLCAVIEAYAEQKSARAVMRVALLSTQPLNQRAAHCRRKQNAA